MSDEQEQTCLNCDFWLPNCGEKEPYNELTCGECHRYPPSVPILAIRGPNFELTEQGSTPDTTLMGWPETYAPEWCGEWSPDLETRCRG